MPFGQVKYRIYFVLIGLLLVFLPVKADIRDIFPPVEGNDTLHITSCMASARHFYETKTPNYDSTLFYLNQAIELSKIQNDLYYTYQLYEFYSQIMHQSGNYHTAIDYYFKMLNLLDEEKKQNESILIKNEYATLYKNIGACFAIIDTEKGLDYFRKGLQEMEEIYKIDPAYKDESEIPLLIYNNISSIWINVANFDSAFYYCQKALNYPVKIDKPPFYALLYNNMGIIYWELKNEDTSFDFFEQSLDVCRQSDDKSGMARVYYNRGLCLRSRKENKKALSEFNNALKLSKESSNIRIEMLSLETLAEVYAEQKNYYQANQMLQFSHVLKDSIAKIDKVSETTRIELQYLFENQLRKSELQQQFIISKKEQKTLISIFVAVFLLFLLIIMLLLYRNQRIKNKKNLLEQQSLALQNENLELKNQQLNKSLDHKDKELNAQMLYVLNKNQFVSSIIENVSEQKGEDVKQIKSTFKDLKLNIEDSIWNEYSVLFQQLHHDFYNKLYKKHPDLTPNEKKLSAFIRLNMSSKEISSTTFQSIKSIEIARSRLRKKLNLNRNENLNVYLQSLDDSQ
ncbi:MAG: tetratricopeptide repeat protein [Tannerella sp.]|jgi:tetratricopeptide (TPR) repeat protein|nr:tetratricopeptide repeat protein [Tannerella sp.]